ASVTTDTNLAYSAGDAKFGTSPKVAAAAYSNNFPGATATTLYVLDTDLDTLALQGSPGGAPTSPNAGLLFTVGPLGLDATAVAGFDITAAGTAFAALTPAGSTGSQLYAIDLNTGAATLLGAVGGGQLLGLTAVPPVTIQFSAANYAVDESAGQATIT